MDGGEIAAVSYRGGVYHSSSYVRDLQNQLADAMAEIARLLAKKDETMFNINSTLTGGADEDSHASRDTLLSGKGLEEAQVVELQKAFHRVEARLIEMGEQKVKGTLQLDGKTEPASAERQDLRLSLNITRDGQRFFRVAFDWAQAPQEVADAIKVFVKEETAGLNLRNPGK